VKSPKASAGIAELLVLAWPVVLARSSQAVIGFSDALMTAAVAALAAAAVPLVRPVLGLLPYEPAVHEQMSEYVEIRLLAVGAIVGTEALGNWYAGLGKTWVQMVAGLLAMVANVLLNWLLIQGHWGAPALGVAGAAVASLCASWLGFALLMLLFWRGWFARGKKIVGRLRLAELVRMLRFGAPNGMNWFLEFAAWALFINVIVAHLGTTALAAMNVVISINSVSFMPAFGLASAGAILAGQAIGRGRHDDVPAIARRTVVVAALWQGSVGVLYLSIPSVLMAWFAPPGEEVGALVTIGTPMLAVSAGWQLFDAAGMTYSEALRAAGDTAWMLLARLLVAWLVFIPGAAVSILVFGAGPVTATLWMVAYMAVLASVLFWRFRTGRWRDIDLTGIGPDGLPEEALLG